jgi:endonuclease/exonuclease/phosphatase family metal-dependent hydrolase
MVLGVVAIVLTLRAQPPLEPVGQADPAPPSSGAAAGVRLHGVAEPIARRPGTLRLCTYNVENLFDDKDDPALSGRYEDAKAAKPEAARRAAAEAIRRVDADVLALEEIESRDALLWFRDQFLAGMGYDHVVSLDAGDERGIEQAVLSRYPLTDIGQWVGQELGGVHPDKFGRDANEHAGEKIKFHRSPLRVTVEAPRLAAEGKPAGEGKTYLLTLFVVHFKSGGGGGYWREAEARGVAARVADFQREHAGANVVVLGDFNSQLSEPPLAALTRADGSAGDRAPVEAELRDVFADRPARDKAVQTHSSGRVLDHVLFNNAAWREVVADSRFVLGTITRPAGTDWRTTPSPEGWASDHYPVVVDLWAGDRE